jgi:hypothetical protein
MEQSPIYRYLAQTSGPVTKQLLVSIIAGVFQQLPPNQRLPPPTRSQKRAKAGLVAWLDDNLPGVFSYLQSQSSIC